MDLADADVRAGLVERLGEVLYGGRPVILGPGILAGYAGTVERCRALGCPVLVVATARGIGPIPDPTTFTLVEIQMPRTVSMTEEVRVIDRVARHLPPHAVAAIEAFDPERRGVWVGSPFVSDDKPILGRRVTSGRPDAFAALEDKMRADDTWRRAGVPSAPAWVLDIDAAALAVATAELDTPLGVVWSGDARDGINGGGNFVRWVRDEHDQAAAFAFFAPRCDRVRVMPFLDGVPCSIHGIVLPEPSADDTRTAVFRPVELAILRDPVRRRFVFGGLSSWWDPPPADREEMRDVARAVGDMLAIEHDYRGAFGIDGVLTTEGFRPTELNTRMSDGITALACVDVDLFALLQACLIGGVDTGVSAADLESLISVMDAERHGRPTAVGQRATVSRAVDWPVAYDGSVLDWDEHDTGSTLSCESVPLGFFARIDPCTLLSPGDRLAPLNAALYALLDRELGTSFGALEVAPDLTRTGGPQA